MYSACASFIEYSIEFERREEITFLKRITNRIDLISPSIITRRVTFQCLLPRKDYIFSWLLSFHTFCKNFQNVSTGTFCKLIIFTGHLYVQTVNARCEFTSPAHLLRNPNYSRKELMKEDLVTQVRKNLCSLKGLVVLALSSFRMVLRIHPSTLVIYSQCT